MRTSGWMLCIGILLAAVGPVAAQTPFCGFPGFPPCTTPPPGPTPTPTPSVPPGCTVQTTVVCSTPSPPTPTPPPSPLPTPTPGPSIPAKPSASPNCLGGQAGLFTQIMDFGGAFGIAYESDVVGGAAPDGLSAAPQGSGYSWWFVGLSSRGHSIWAPRHSDQRGTEYPPEALIQSAVSAVGGTRYLEVYPPDSRTGQCAIYEAGTAGGPPPGLNYVRVGTSGDGGIPTYSLGSGLPIYARSDASQSLIVIAVRMTRGTIP